MIDRPQSRGGIDFNLVLERFNQRLTSWALGTGLLAFHAGVFFLTMTGLIFWNVYDNPKDFWAGDLLKRWGAILTLHVVVTVAATVGWRLLRSADIQEARQGQWQPVARPPIVTDGSWRALESGPPIDPQPYVPPGEVEIPVFTATQRLRNNAARRLAKLRGKEDDVSPAATASWPEPPARRDAEADDLIRQFGSAGRPESDAAPVKDRRAGQARWTWIEAAATSWLTKKEADDEEPPERRPRVNPPSPPPAHTDDDDDGFASL